VEYVDRKPLNCKPIENVLFRGNSMVLLVRRFMLSSKFTGGAEEIEGWNRVIDVILTFPICSNLILVERRIDVRFLEVFISL
jgi:hypothetical protein